MKNHKILFDVEKLFSKFLTWKLNLEDELDLLEEDFKSLVREISEEEYKNADET